MLAEMAPTLTPRHVAGSIEELIGGATLREPMDKHGESLSGSTFERIVIEDEPYVLKHLHVDDDWIQRASGDVVCRPMVTWRSGLFDALPRCLDHTVAGVARGLGRNGWGAAVLMRDVSPWLVDVSSGIIPIDQHRRFIDHMAELHASFWGWRDTIGLMPIGGRWSIMSPLMASMEATRGGTDPVPPMIARGWPRVASEAPRATRVALALVEDPSPLVDAVTMTPSTLIHADWKAGNLGTLPDGRTILIDWAFHGEGPGCSDLTWYIGVNCDLLPESKEATIDAYRDSLERRGVDTAPWWDRQLDLCIIGTFCHMGWSKSGAELAWWEERVPRAARFLG